MNSPFYLSVGSTALSQGRTTRGNCMDQPCTAAAQTQGLAFQMQPQPLCPIQWIIPCSLLGISWQLQRWLPQLPGEQGKPQHSPGRSLWLA